MLRVLLASDTGEGAQAVRRELENEGCNVTVASSGAAVLETDQARFDLIFLDLELPDMDGLSVLKRMRTDSVQGGPPIVLIKGESEPPHTIQRGLDMGAAGFVVKHRLRAHLLKGSLVDTFLGPPPRDNDRRQVPRSPLARRDACPYSAGGDFSSCPVFVPIEISIGEDGTGSRTSCSHLRVGTAATWRLYPRCALGDAAAREKYLQDLSC